MCRSIRRVPSPSQGNSQKCLSLWLRVPLVCDVKVAQAPFEPLRSWMRHGRPPHLYRSILSGLLRLDLQAQGTAAMPQRDPSRQLEGSRADSDAPDAALALRGSLPMKFASRIAYPVKQDVSSPRG